MANAGIERLSVITTLLINPVLTAFEMLAKFFIFLYNFSLLEISFKNWPQLCLFCQPIIWLIYPLL